MLCLNHTLKNIATHEVMFAFVELFGCFNFARSVVFHRPYLKEAFQRIKK